MCENVQEQKLSPFIRDTESRVRQGVRSARSSSEDLVGCGYTSLLTGPQEDYVALALERFGTSIRFQGDEEKIIGVKEDQSNPGRET